MLKEFTASNFSGNCVVDEDFIPCLEKMNDIAVRYRMKVIVTSSFRKDTNVSGAIVTPAKKSNHLVGHAIDCNLQDIVSGEYFNSKKMADDKGIDLTFCNEVVKQSELYWGMAFNVPDSVHFDNRLNVKNPELWQIKYNEIHSNIQTI